MVTTRDSILKAAERMVRAGGYNGFSFRDIASEIGIKSASVHHHFPTKEDLAREVAGEYSRNFFEVLGEPEIPGCDPEERLKRYCEVFRSAFESDGNACLCGILSSEAAQIPESVRERISEFVDSNLAWLEKAMGSGGTPEKASLIYMALEGAMGVAALKQDAEWVVKAGQVACDAVL